MNVIIRPMEKRDVEVVHSSGVEVESFQTTEAEADQSPF